MSRDYLRHLAKESADSVVYLNELYDNNLIDFPSYIKHTQVKVPFLRKVEEKSFLSNGEKESVNKALMGHISIVRTQDAVLMQLASL